MGQPKVKLEIDCGKCSVNLSKLEANTYIDIYDNEFEDLVSILPEDAERVIEAIRACLAVASEGG